VQATYANYRRYWAAYEGQSRTFKLGWSGMGAFLENGTIRSILLPDKRSLSLEEFKDSSARAEDIPDGRILHIRFTGGPEEVPELDLQFVLSARRIALEVRLKEDCAMAIEGALLWGDGMERSTFACRCDRKGGDLRLASGPAASRIDNCLFDRLTDRLLEVAGAAEFRMDFSWKEGRYRFLMNSGSHLLTRRIGFVVHDRYFENKFSVPYRPVRGETQFKTPPVGWMTWYALKFNVSEKSVLENAQWLSENLGAYGANCIWVDWEWYHSRIRSAGEHPDIDTFHPDPRRYPGGLKFLAEEIKRRGLVPAIWIGATNDPNRNGLLAAHPEWILAEQVEWCGRWWIDPSHPEVIASYIPSVFRQLMEWGFEAVKWDCLPISLEIADAQHGRFRRPEKSSEEALRDLIAAAREVLGPHRYMMSCSGHGLRDIGLAIDLFDGGRIGGDVFGWDEYVRNAVAPALKYLCFHNVLFYADLDNVVVRGEYNTIEQARSRVSFTGMSGTPVTLGDPLPELEAERIELLKRIIPVADIHPMDLDEHVQDLGTIVVNLLVAREFEQWNVVDVFNTTDGERTVAMDLAADLHLESGQRYLVFDFWAGRFLGAYDRMLHLKLPPFGSVLFSARRFTGVPQILSTSRHITQGAVDLRRVAWDGSGRTLTVESACVAHDPYAVHLYVPDPFLPTGVTGDCPAEIAEVQGRVWTVKLSPAGTGIIHWEVRFSA
jgi:hypothetical protein